MTREDLAVHLPAITEFLKGLVPGALGAAVAVAVQGSMPWLQRFIQLTVGIVVSYYAGELAHALLGATDIAKSSVGFVAGIGAFEVVKKLRVSLGEVAQEAPRDVWAAVKRKLGL